MSAATAVRSDRFSYDPASRVFCAEASEVPEFSSAGLVLVSARTGTEASCRVTRVVRDREGDVSYWVLAPTQRLRGKFTVHILND